MTDFETRNAATVLRQIAKYGADVVLTRAGAKTYDPATSCYTETGGSTQTIKAVVSDMRARIDSAQGLNIQSGDKQLSVAASNFVKPKIGDTLTVLGDTYTIVPIAAGGLEIETVMAANTPVLYKIHGRRR